MLITSTNINSQHCDMALSSGNFDLDPDSQLMTGVTDFTYQEDLQLDCEKQIPLKHRLARDMRTQNGKKYYECEECKKKFSSKSHLAVHMRIHSGEKPYECETCKKKFSTKSNLASHMRTHTSEKP